MDYRTIGFYKRELRNFKYYKERISNLKAKRGLLYDKINGLRTIHYDEEKVQGSPDFSRIEEERLNTIDKINDINVELEKYYFYVDRINECLRAIDKPISKAIYRIYCSEESTLSKEADRLYLSKDTLKRFINRQLDNFINLKK